VVAANTTCTPYEDLTYEEKVSWNRKWEERRKMDPSLPPAPKLPES
jgi:hypothetical protein